MSDIRYIGMVGKSPVPDLSRRSAEAWTSESARPYAPNVSRILVVDLDELPRHDFTDDEAFTYAERQMLRWTSEVLRLRPGQELASVPVRDEAIERLREAYETFSRSGGTWQRKQALYAAIDAVLARSGK